MTTRVNLYVDQGIDFLLRLQVQLDDNSSNGLVFYSSSRKMYSSTKLFDIDVVVEDGTDDYDVDLELRIQASETRDLSPGKYQYDVIYVNQDGEVKKLVEGILDIIPTITRPE